jgi:tRNA nucleotidyltransferase (CCA-adding enzyme)
MTIINNTSLKCCHLCDCYSERAIFALLLDAAKANNGRTVIRIAGGWVRDKLLGRDSDDIDVALDNVSGNAFAKVSAA